MMFKINNHRILVVVLLINGYVMATKGDGTCKNYGLSVDNPGISCHDIYEKNLRSHGKSSPYLIKTDKLFLTQCDIAQVADLDISRGDKCPQEWKEITIQGVKLKLVDLQVTMVVAIQSTFQ